MYSYGSRSKTRLSKAHPKLQRIANRLIKIMNVTILESVRSKEVQDSYFERKVSKLQWPKSLHNLKSGRNETHSLALDIAPWHGGIDWNDKAGFYMMVGMLKSIAYDEGIKIRCGADWDGDNDTKDQSFHDLPHIELHSSEW